MKIRIHKSVVENALKGYSVSFKISSGKTPHELKLHGSDYLELSGDPVSERVEGECCVNGKFSDGHLCLKQPANEREVEHEKPCCYLKCCGCPCHSKEINLVEEIYKEKSSDFLEMADPSLPPLEQEEKCPPARLGPWDVNPAWVDYIRRQTLKTSASLEPVEELSWPTDGYGVGIVPDGMSLANKINELVRSHNRLLKR